MTLTGATHNQPGRAAGFRCERSRVERTGLSVVRNLCIGLPFDTHENHQNADRDRSGVFAIATRVGRLHHGNGRFVITTDPLPSAICVCRATIGFQGRWRGEGRVERVGFFGHIGTAAN